MYSVSIETQLHALRPGDRVMYASVDWDVKDYSTYFDPQGYQTEEWLLISSSGAEYYLLREFEPDEDMEPVTWYISHQLENVRLYVPNSQEDIVPRLWQEMQALTTPYPELQLFYKTYYFDSQTEGSYDAKGKTKSRITWDYWDETHSVNLAIEAFGDRKLDIYSSKVVKPNDFYNIQKGVGDQVGNNSLSSKIVIELIMAITVIATGILLIIFG